MGNGPSGYRHLFSHIILSCDRHAEWEDGMWADKGGYLRGGGGEGERAIPSPSCTLLPRTPHYTMNVTVQTDGPCYMH